MPALEVAKHHRLVHVAVLGSHQPERAAVRVAEMHQDRSAKRGTAARASAETRGASSMVLLSEEEASASRRRPSSARRCSVTSVTVPTHSRTVPSGLRTGTARSTTQA